MDSILEVLARIPSNEPELTHRHTYIDTLLELYSLPQNKNPEMEICSICGEETCPLVEFQEWIGCESCGRWVHQACDGIINPSVAQNLSSYHCPMCRCQQMEDHPVNTNEALGRDPKYIQQQIEQQQQKKKNNQRKRSKRSESDTEGDEKSHAVSTNGQSGNGNKESTNYVVSGGHSNLRREQEQPPQYTQQELDSQFGADRIGVRESYDHKKCFYSDMCTQQLQQSANAALNQTRIPTSTVFKSIQDQAKIPTAIQLKDADIIKDDVGFFNIFGVYLRQESQFKQDIKQLQASQTQIEQLQIQQQLKIQEIERERRVSQQIAQSISQAGPSAQIQNPRSIFRQLIPVLPQDSDLRVKLGLAIFDTTIESVERYRFEYIKTLIPMVAHAAYCCDQPGYIIALPPESFLKAAQIHQMTSYKELNLSYTSYLPAEQLLAKLDPKLPKLPDHIPAMPPSIPDSLKTDKPGDLDHKMEKKDLGFEGDRIKAEKPIPLPLRTEQKSGDMERRSTDFIPRIDFNQEHLSPRQRLDLTRRGVQMYRQVGTVRSTFLHAIVNMGLGLNVFDKPLGEVVTDHMIKYGVSSSRRLVKKLLSQGCELCHIEPGCLYEKVAEGKEELIGKEEMISGDQKIQDWDILETPASVVWGIQCVGEVLKSVQTGSK